MAFTWHPDLRKYAYAKPEELNQIQVLLEEVRGEAGTCDLCRTGRSKHYGALNKCWACRHTYHHICIDVLRLRAAGRGEQLAYGCPHCGRPWATLAMLEQQAEEAARRPGPGRSPRRSLPFSDGLYTFTFEAATRQYLCKWEDRISGGICWQGPFDTFDDFYRHYTTAHAEILVYQCELCEAEPGFVSAKLLVQHKKNVHYGDPRSCDEPESSASATPAEGEAVDPSASLVDKVELLALDVVETATPAEGEAVDPSASLAEKVELLALDVVESIEDEAMNLDE